MEKLFKKQIIAEKIAKVFSPYFQGDEVDYNACIANTVKIIENEIIRLENENI